MSDAQIIDQLRETLPAYMVPSRLLFVDEFPLNQSGKIDKNRASIICVAGLGAQGRKPGDWCPACLSSDAGLGMTGWDSLNHTTLVVELEDRLMSPLTSTSWIGSYGYKIVESLQAKGVVG